MWKVSNIISSFVVSVFDGQVEGVVNNILFNNKKQAKYLIISRNDEEFFVLDTKDIYKLGNNTVIIKNSTVLNLMDNKEQEINLPPTSLTLLSLVKFLILLFKFSSNIPDTDAFLTLSVMSLPL